MLAIRLRRVGKKKQPHYRVVVIDSSKTPDARFIEILGHTIILERILRRSTLKKIG